MLGHMNQTGPWTIFAGVVVAAIGGILMGVAAKAKEKAELGLSFGNALSGREYESSPELAAAVSQGHLGLGLLIFGGALFLVGLVLTGLRRQG